MFTGEWVIKIIDVGYKTGRSIYIYRRTDRGREFLDGTILKEGENSADIKPTLELEPEQLQVLADSLAAIGYKPAQGFTDGKLQATEKHLEDMRKLVFK